MKYLVGYNGSSTSRRALELARDHARLTDSMLYVIYSMEGGAAETAEDIQKAGEALEEVKSLLADSEVRFEALQLARGFSPGEDLVKYADDNKIDHVFIGIEKKSKTRKILLGSTAQYIILKAPCPVTTTK